jgi:hypothetical protein
MIVKNHFNPSIKLQLHKAISACFFLSLEREGEGERIHLFAWKQAVQNCFQKDKGIK